MCVQEEMYIYVCENFINLHGCQAVFESKIEIKIASFAIFVARENTGSRTECLIYVPL